MKTALLIPVLAAALLYAPATRAALVNYEMVQVGDAGNAADASGFGAVSYVYQIGKHEVTIGQYAAFLNSVAHSDPYGLYKTNMGTDLNVAGIARTGSSGSYTYTVIGPSGTTPLGASSASNRPITYVSWFDAARFANWMNNGQGSADTETGAYTLNGITSGTAPARNPGSQFYIPTENEWYKAAFFKGGAANAGYWTFATQSDSDPGNSPGNQPNQVNYRENLGATIPYAVTQVGTYSANQNYLTEVGAFTASSSAYGTFDQSGNVWEWNDLTGAAGTTRGRRGGYWDSAGTIGISSADRFSSISPTLEVNTNGFRLAGAVSPVPEPSTYAMALAGLACGGFSMWRRRKRA